MIKETNKPISYETFLPLFSGFYGTIFDDTEHEETQAIEAIESINGQRYHKGQILEVKENDFNFDYESYREEYAKNICNAVNNLFYNIIDLNIDYETLQSPKEYNFRNDSIDCTITLNDKKGILKYIHKDNETSGALAKYIKENYTSYDGFSSNYSNYIIDWKEETKNFTDFSCNSHYLGAILDFILLNEGITEESLFHKAERPILEQYADTIDFEELDDFELLEELSLSESDIEERSIKLFYSCLNEKLVFGNIEQINALKAMDLHNKEIAALVAASNE